jgi:EAL and modified HD-GYP domain-containing signal transduction protein
LLRLVNSALFGLRQEVTSIKTALLTIGDQQFRKLASIAITTELGEKHPDELLVLALARARFCELGAKSTAEDPTEQYLLGLFSLLPAIMQTKVEDLLPLLPFRLEIQEALQGKENQTRRLLGCFEHYEQGDWQQCMKICTSLGTSEPIVAGMYADAIRWAERAMSVS